jgi:hypothetical protein
MARGSKAAAAADRTEEGLDALLHKNWDEIPQSAILPDGTFRYKVRGMKLKAGGDNYSPSINLAATPLAPMEDVDVDAYAALGDNYDPSVNVVYKKFWLSEAKDFDELRKFLAKINVETAGKDLEASLKETKGRTFLGYTTTNVRPDNRTGETITENVITAVAADDAA